LFSLGWLFKIENPQNTLLQNFTVEQVACTHLESWTINLKHLTDKFSSNKNNSEAFAILSKKITSSLNIFLSVLVFCTQLEVLNLQRWNWTWWHFVCRLHSYWGMWCHCYCSDNEISVISSVHVAWETSLARCPGLQSMLAIVTAANVALTPLQQSSFCQVSCVCPIAYLWNVCHQSSLLLLTESSTYP
jgi:hypothetical protein